MKQPELGRRIAELRKVKGLTQEDLVSKCNLNVRTLQRIESGSVTPRSYTIKEIAAALGHELSDLSNHMLKNTVEEKTSGRIADRLRELFNLKIYTMTKVSVLLATVLIAGFSIYTQTSRASGFDEKNYVKDTSRGIKMYLERNLNRYGCNGAGDTLYVWAGKDVIQEYNSEIFLNGEFAGHAKKGETLLLENGILYNKQRLSSKKNLWVYNPAKKSPSFTVNNVNYITPVPLSNPKSTEKGEIYPVGKHIIHEKDNKIYLNDVYQGEAFTNDTVILRDDRLIIKRYVTSNVSLLYDSEPITVLCNLDKPTKHKLTLFIIDGRRYISTYDAPPATMSNTSEIESMQIIKDEGVWSSDYIKSIPENTREKITSVVIVTTKKATD